MSDMNVGMVSGVAATYQSTETKSTAKTSTENNKKKDDSKVVAEKEGVVLEKGTDDQKKAPYKINKMSPEERAALVQQLKQDEENRRSQLSSLVQQMLSGQAGASNLANLFSPENLKNVSAADIAQAKEDISEDGYYGIKQTSQRLFDFASALAGDDVDKMKEMQDAMMKGFEQATKAWGKELPEICKNTIDAANKLFDDYYASKKVAE